MPFFKDIFPKYMPLPQPNSLAAGEDEFSSGDLSSEDGLLEKHVEFARRKPSWLKRHGRIMAVQTLILLLHATILLTFVCLFRTWIIRSLGGPGVIYAPAREAVTYREVKFNHVNDHRYTGPPSEELDQEWHDLLDGANFIVSASDLKHVGRLENAVQVPDGSGYIATMSMYHELHCIKRIHQFMYPSYYWPNLTSEQTELNMLHNEHCLDFLRQAALCRGDIALTTFSREPSGRIPIATPTTHECVDSDRLMDWTKQRTVDMMKPGWLQHPTLGAAYPAGQGSAIGAKHGHTH